MMNVILHYQDGSAFICAEGVTLARAEEIKAQIEREKAAGDFSYRDVMDITIQEVSHETK